MTRKRKLVLALLYVTVLSPIVLYTDRLSLVSNPSSNIEVGDEGSNLRFGASEAEPGELLHALSQELTDPVKEPIGVVYFDNSNSSNQVSATPEDGLISPKVEEMPSRSSEEHKSRVLSAAVDGGLPEIESVIKEVTDGAIEKVDATGKVDAEKPESVEDSKVNKSKDSAIMPTSISQAAVDGGLLEIESMMKEVTDGAIEKVDAIGKVDAEIHESVEDSKVNKSKDSAIMPTSISQIQQRKSENNGQQTPDRIDVPEHQTVPSDKKSIRTPIADVRVRQLKDQLIRAKVYLGIGPIRSNPHYVRELRLRIKEIQRTLGEATKDSHLPKHAFDKLKAMELTLAKGNQILDDCSSIEKKLRAMILSSEEQLRVHKKQALFLTQLAAKTIPKGLHCLPLRLTNEYFSLNSSQQQFANQEKLDNPGFHHYAVFSDNVLATAVVVNSTISNAKNPADHVFHIVTDRLNYAAMRMWFLANPPVKATIQVQYIEEFTWLNESYSPVLKQLRSRSMIDFYFRSHHGSANSDANLKYRNPKYLSILNHLRFYLPEIFPKLSKVVFLDDDVVVQKDLTGLWKINMNGKVNGAIETCGESFHRFDRYLNFSNPLIAKNFNPRACGWAYGMNVFDLDEWRKQQITGVYHYWQNMNVDRQLWKLGSLPPGLLTFYNRTLPIDPWWHILGLGYNTQIDQKEIEKAAVIHYNGNLKPWLDIGISQYRRYWSKYLDYDHPILRDCNINP